VLRILFEPLVPFERVVGAADEDASAIEDGAGDDVLFDVDDGAGDDVLFDVDDGAGDDVLLSSHPATTTPTQSC